jgi:16S rRNA (adenine1518-N6/adenine1519-N6)-dimethyltransferase
VNGVRDGGPADVHSLLRRWGLRLKKDLGQNFLADPAILSRIVAAADLTPEDTVLEIGAGLGTLTTQLARQAGRVVAVEVDRQLIPALEDALSGLENVTLVHGDILTLDLTTLIGADRPYYVVANLPYYITSAVLRHVLEADHRPRRVVVTVQQEVAERITAQPGDMSLLAVSVQFYGQPRQLFRIKPGSFYPAPAVASAVVRIDLHDAPPVPVDDAAAFFRVVRAGFSQRRKQLRNTLAAGLHLPPDEVAARLEQVGVDPRRRAETLSLAEWGQVVGVLNI